MLAASIATSVRRSIATLSVASTLRVSATSTRLGMSVVLPVIAPQRLRITDDHFR